MRGEISGGEVSNGEIKKPKPNEVPDSKFGKQEADKKLENMFTPEGDVILPGEQDKSNEAEVKEGGSYKDVIVPGEGGKKEVHHMPSNDSTDLSLGDGPAIKMDKQDHRQTESCGNSKEAQEYRKKQREFVEAGEFRKAVQMDIDDIKEKFGNKYDKAISEMLKYVDKLEEEGMI